VLGDPSFRKHRSRRLPERLIAKAPRSGNFSLAPVAVGGDEECGYRSEEEPRFRSLGSKWKNKELPNEPNFGFAGRLAEPMVSTYGPLTFRVPTQVSAPAAARLKNGLYVLCDYVDPLRGLGAWVGD
jgi:hypothetical protein